MSEDMELNKAFEDIVGDEHIGRLYQIDIIADRAAVDANMLLLRPLLELGSFQKYALTYGPEKTREMVAIFMSVSEQLVTYLYHTWKGMIDSDEVATVLIDPTDDNG